MHGLQLFTWNTQIAANAQAWADSTKGVMQHSTSTQRTLPGIGYVGENLAWGIVTAGAVDLWYDEIKKTSGGLGLVSTWDGNVGHYTQIVWKSSIMLGCGVFDKLLVCQYGPGGNMMNSFSTQVVGPVPGAVCP